MPEKHRTRKGSKDQRANDKRQHKLFYFFFGALFLVLPYVILPQALDRALMSRLLVLSLILLPTGLLLFHQIKPDQDELAVLRQWLFPIIGAFLVVGMISSLFAINHREVYFDITKTALFLVGAFCSALLILRTPSWQEKLSRLAILSSIPALLIGAVQYVQRVVMYGQEFLPDGRPIEYAVTAVMAHKNIYSVYMALLLPLTAFGAYRFRRGWQIAAIVTSLLMLVMILMLKTRSAWLGLSAGLFSSAILLLIHGKSIQLTFLWRNGIMASLILFIILLATIMWTGSTAQEFTIAGRVYSIIDPKSPHNIHRFTAWQSSLEMIHDHPLTGVGPGNWRIKAPYYFGGKDVGIGSVNWARPHNDFLWVFAERGFVGILLFAAIFWVGFLYLLRIIRAGPRQTGKSEKIFSLCLISGIAIYLTDSMFSFPYERIEIQALLFVMLGASTALHQKLHPKPRIRIKTRWLKAFIILSCGFGLLLGYQATRMEVRLNRAIQAISQENWPQTILEARASRTPFRSLDNSGYPVDYFIGLAYAGMQEQEASYTAYHSALEQSPRNVWLLYHLSLSCLNLGRIEEAEKHLLNAKQVLSGSPNILSNLSNIYYSQGKYQKALEMLIQIDDWEQDPSIQNNVRILNRLLDEQGVD